jgi:hypothetical protein
MAKLWCGIDLVSELGKGVSITAIAKRTGRAPMTVYAAARRRGIDVVKTRGYKVGPVRAQAQAMDPEDAVDFLLGVIETQFPHLSEQIPDVLAPVARKLTPSERILASALVDASPNTLTYEAVYTALYEWRAPKDRPDPKAIKPLLTSLRKKLPESIGMIETMWGRGYRFVKAADCPVQIED